MRRLEWTVLTLATLSIAAVLIVAACNSGSNKAASDSSVTAKGVACAPQGTPCPKTTPEPPENDANSDAAATAVTMQQTMVAQMQDVVSFTLTAVAKGDVWIKDVQMVSGDSSGVACPSGYTKVNQDLNQGAGGKWVYLCYAQTVYQEEALGAFEVLLANSGSVDCGGTINDKPTHKAAGADGNAGTGGAWIHYCIATGKQDYGAYDVPFAIKGIFFQSSATYYLGSPCYDGLSPTWDVSRVNPDGWELAAKNQNSNYVGSTARGDMNEGAGGHYIYTCVFKSAWQD